jgi:hypothetical protein
MLIHIAVSRLAPIVSTLVDLFWTHFISILKFLAHPHHAIAVLFPRIQVFPHGSRKKE